MDQLASELKAAGEKEQLPEEIPLVSALLSSLVNMSGVIRISAEDMKSGTAFIRCR